MKHVTLLLFVATICCSVLVSNRDGLAQVESGFRSIFNGVDLKGWDGNPKFWSVRDGVITGTTTKENPTRGNTFLIWRAGTLSDFELRLQYRIVGGNSGIQYRSREVGKWVISGYQADFESGSRYSGILYEEKGRGILAERGTKVSIGPDGKKSVVGKTLPADKIQQAIKAEDWNDYTIVASGNHLIHKINGMTSVEVTDHQESKRRMSGLLALQLHAGPPMVVQFRNVRLRTGAGVPQAAKTPISLDKAHWVWHQSESSDGEVVFFRKKFVVPGKVKSASIIATCDNRMQVFLNGGKPVLKSDTWESPVSADVKSLRPGNNILAVRGVNDGSAAGLILKLSATLEDGKKFEIVTDENWWTASDSGAGWQKYDYDEEGWSKVHVHGRYGVGPWNVLTNAGGAPSSTVGSQSTPADALEVLKGFQVERLYSVPKGQQGSWVSLTEDDKGRLIASDQYGALYRVTPPRLGAPASETFVERLDVKIGAAHGLLYAFDSLYVVVNGKSHDKGSGLYRVRDTNGDDQFDSIETLKTFRGGGEHGPHAVIVAEDGEDLYVIGGNHTDVPDGLDSTSPVPLVWKEDLLLPRQWDARGHARGKLAPGGWICRTDRDGKKWKIVSNGYRNQYDIALNRHGELFTYDADMEWDLGTPWYRPTRVNHATSGSEFGWRSGTGKWPPYYIDSLPATADIGPGCPTGVVFGTGANFPAKYQDAFYVLDWTFGTMYAVHMTPDGSSYTGEVEQFVSGKPLPLTDAVIGKDGAMYFTVGGRRTQSGLYRVTYGGKASTAPATDGTDAKTLAAAEARALRRKIEAYHGTRDAGAIDAVWPHLSHADRFIRYAARIALEHQELSRWQERALRESNPTALLTALAGLVRHANAGVQPQVLAALGRLDPATLDRRERLDLLRVYALTFARTGRPDAVVARRIGDRLGAIYPSNDPMVDRELCRVLCYLDWPGVIDPTLKLMAAAPPEKVEVSPEIMKRNPGYGNTVLEMMANTPEQQKIHYALALRNVRYGWTLEQRREYFGWFDQAAKAKGGASYHGFINNIKKEALANASEAERAALADVTGEKVEASKESTELPTPKGPGKAYTMAHLEPMVREQPSGRNFDNGKTMYAAARCGTCHRFDGSGGSVGPDLTSVSGRFSYRDLLESLLEPNKVISDQYESSVVVTNTGDVYTGRVVSEEGDSISIAADPLNPGTLVTVKKTAVASKKRSEQSLMPADLLNGLNQDEVLDLLAYLMSRGNKNDPVYR